MKINASDWRGVMPAVSLTLALFMVSIGDAKAERVTYEFSGVVDRSDWGRMNVGDVIAGEFTIDTKGEQLFQTETLAEYRGLDHIRVSIAGTTFEGRHLVQIGHTPEGKDSITSYDIPGPFLDGSGNLSLSFIGNNLFNDLSLSNASNMDLLKFTEKIWGFVLQGTQIFNVWGTVRDLRRKQ